MRREILILAASILVNAAFGYGIYRARQPVVPPTETAPPAAQPPTSKKAVFGSKTPAVSMPVAVVETTNAPAFRWAMLESEDFKEYIARLRAFGVPEKVVRDIILAEISSLYRPKYAALRPPPNASRTNYWKRNPYGGGVAQTVEQREETRRLQKEQRELVKALFGDKVYAEMARDSGTTYVDPLEKIVGSENTAVLEQLRGIRERLQEKEQDIYAKTQGFSDQWTQEDLKKLRKAGRDEFAKLLTPEQLEQYELRNSDTAQQLRYNAGPFEPTEDEFKALFLFKQSPGQSRPGQYDDDGNQIPLNPEQTAAYTKAVKDSEEALKTALGEDRLKEFKLFENDYGLRNMAEAGVPKENLFKVADVKTQAETASRRLQIDRNLTPEQRKEALGAIYSETMKELGSLLGERQAKAYRGNGGYWLQNIKPRETTP